ncbi:M28 family peptidase [Crocosphaera sp. Alani8]|uniref:M28 family peptidase n=1 Tax=Crocosphaera sp. Alani8 TaxID=3038952 RepID=UPI00313D99A9
MIDNIKQNLENHLKEIVRERDPFLSTQGHFYVKEYIRQEFKKWGKLENFEFNYNNKTYENLILNLPSKPNSKSKPPILIGAHFDTVIGSAGADDNGTGIAVLLELARFFYHYPSHYPIRLVAFDLEKYGLVGSSAYADSLKQQKQKIRLMISLEMLGYCNPNPNSQLYPPGINYFYPSTGDFIALIGNLSTIPDLIKISGCIRKKNSPCEWLVVPFGGKIVSDTRRSDHAPFWDNNYKGIMITDTANLRNPNYHKPSDTLDTIDLDFLAGVCYGLATAIQNF